MTKKKELIAILSLSIHLRLTVAYFFLVTIQVYAAHFYKVTIVYFLLTSSPLTYLLLKIIDTKMLKLGLLRKQAR